MTLPIGPGFTKCRAHSSTMYPALAHESFDAHASSLVSWTATSPARSPNAPACAARRGGGGSGGSGGGGIIVALAPGLSRRERARDIFRSLRCGSPFGGEPSQR